MLCFTLRSIRCTIYWTLTLRQVGNIPQGVVKVIKIILPAGVVQMLDSSIHRLDHYPVDNTIIGFCTTYPLDSELSGEQRYPTFEQLNRGLGNFTFVETTPIRFLFCLSAFAVYSESNSPSCFPIPMTSTFLQF